jgi:hypothetical protein
MTAMEEKVQFQLYGISIKEITGSTPIQSAIFQYR